MIVFVLLGHIVPVLALALLGMLYLSCIELRHEPLSARVKVWWIMFVGLFNIVGFIILRGGLAVWRTRGRPGAGSRS